MDIFFVTHFVKEPPASEGYVKVSFMTATSNSLKSRKFFMGFGTQRSFSEEYLLAKIDAGTLVKLPVIKKITIGKGLWMDPNKNVFLADLKDPFLDNTIEKVYDSPPNSAPIDFSQRTQEKKRISNEIDVTSLYQSVFKNPSIGTKRLTINAYYSMQKKSHPDKNVIKRVRSKNRHTLTNG